MKTINEVLQESNSTTNQQIKGEFVANHVYCNVNSLVEYCLSKGFEDSNSPVNLDELENYYTFPEWSKDLQGETLYFEGGTQEQKDSFLAEFERLIEESENLLESEKISELTHERNVELIEEAKEEFENLESEPQEVFEWWAVSEYLFRQLRERGYVVIITGSCYVWGRTTTGQAILLDGIISRICADMEILDGQSNSWAKN